MARKPRDYDAELQALMDRAKKVKSQKTIQLGELVQVVGADALPIEAIAGALLAAVEQSKKTPEAVARWTERGQSVLSSKRHQAGKQSSNHGDTAGKPCRSTTAQAPSAWPCCALAAWSAPAPATTDATVGPKTAAPAPATLSNSAASCRKAGLVEFDGRRPRHPARRTPGNRIPPASRRGTGRQA